MADHDVFAGFDGGDRRVPVRVVEEDHRAAAGFLVSQPDDLEAAALVIIGVLAWHSPAKITKVRLPY
jgi:hypothetical protein